jgi:hypothetical protein
MGASSRGEGGRPQQGGGGEAVPSGGGEGGGRGGEIDIEVLWVRRDRGACAWGQREEEMGVGYSRRREAWWVVLLYYLYLFVY